MDSEKFAKMVYENSNFQYDICPPPIDAQCGLNILIEHFLGQNWYTIMPLSQKQVNTEAIYEILRKYPEKKSLKDMIKETYYNLKAKYKLWKTERLSKKLTKASKEAKITVQEIREEIHKMFKQEKDKYIEEILNHGHNVQQWKLETCLDKNKPGCLDCVSGGSMLWAFCTDMQEEYYKKFDRDLVKEN